MKNQATISTSQTVNNTTEKFQVNVSPFAVAIIIAMVGITFLAINGMNYGVAYLFFLPIITSAYTAVKSIMSLDFDFTLDNDMMKEIHEDLYAC